MMKAGPVPWRPHEVEAVAGLGQPDVAQDDVGRLALDERGGRRDVAGRPDDLHAGRPLDSAARPSAIAGWSSTMATRIMSTVSAAARVGPGLRRRARGSRTVIDVPLPTREVASISPPWAVTISRATYRPRPRPGARCGWPSRV